MAFDAIADLTDDQIIEVLFRPETPAESTTLEDGSVITGSWPKLTYQSYRKTWLACGKAEDWIETEWEKDYGPVPVEQANEPQTQETKP